MWKLTDGMGRSSTILFIVLLLGMGCAVEPVHVFADDETTIYALYINLDGHGGFTVDPESPWGPGYAEVFLDLPWPDPDYGDLYLYEYGTVVTVTIIGDGISNTTNTRYFYDGVAGYGDGGYTGESQVFQVTMISDIEEDVEWRSEYTVIFDASGITGSTGLNTVVTVGGVAKVKADLPFSAWYSYGAIVTFTYSSPVAGAYDLSSTIVTMTDASGHLYSTGVTNTHTVTGPATIMSTYIPHPTTPSVPSVGSTTPATSPSSGGLGILSIFTGVSETLRDFWGTISSWGSGDGGLSLGAFGAWFNGFTYAIPNIAIVLLAILGFMFLIVWRRRRKDD